ncbi:MAG: hypothetical protein NZ750_09320 [Anaerolineae bacterium]|nr:hypothetical protein [Anaerolineae bacterium]MDW8171819.1 DICT sensory domain-containing protein [Anaerolineae bacterium]
MSEFNIDPSFSVYELVSRTKRDASVIQHRRAMSVISHAIEDATLVDGARTTVYSGFQIMSKFLRQVKRYTEMARKSEHVYVFGVPDVKVPHIPNITYIPLQPHDRLAKEWFIVSFGPTYYSALATEELTSVYDPDHLRQFKGIWSFDYNLVNILQDWLADTVGTRRLTYNDTSQPDPRQEANYINQAIDRLKRRIAREQDEVLRQELTYLIVRGLKPVTGYLSAAS